MKFSEVIKHYQEIIDKPHMAKMPMILNGVKNTIKVLSDVSGKEVSKDAVEKLDLSDGTKTRILVIAGVIEAPAKAKRVSIKAKDKEIKQLTKEVEKKDKEIAKLTERLKKA
jgi:predicted DNA-binding antitoxin AbrB/MazE fold protein